MTNRDFMASKRFKRALAEGSFDASVMGVRKHYNSVIKEDEDKDSRILHFTISTGAVDRDRDTIKPDGWELDSYKQNPVVLFAHDGGRPPVGRALDVTKSAKSLRATAEFMGNDIDTTGFSDTIFRMLKGGFLKATSVGFIPMEFEAVDPDEKGNENRIGGVDFTKQELLEFSVVPVPSNPEALVEARSKGINMSPLHDWMEEALDDWANYKNGLLIPKSHIEGLFKQIHDEQTFFELKTTKSLSLPVDEQDALLAENLKSIQRGDKMNGNAERKSLMRVATRVFGQPLIIHPQKLDAILQVMGPKLGLDATQLEKIGEIPETFTKAKKDERPYKIEGGVARIPVLGTLVHDHAYLDSYSGMTSYNVIQDKFTEALADSDVKAIALDIDSPGGEAATCFDLADMIYEARGTKPIVAVVNDMAFSAAYAIASAADHIIVSRSGGVGSVGVVMVHVDASKYDEMKGVKYTLLHYGDHKVDGNSFEPLSDEVKEDMEAELTKFGEQFVKLVARNLGKDEEEVRATQARCYYGEDAIEIGFAHAMSPATKTFEAIAKGTYLELIEGDKRVSKADDESEEGEEEENGNEEDEEDEKEVDAVAALGASVKALMSRLDEFQKQASASTDVSAITKRLDELQKQLEEIRGKKEYEIVSFSVVKDKKKLFSIHELTLDDFGQKFTQYLTDQGFDLYREILTEDKNSGAEPGAEDDDDVLVIIDEEPSAEDDESSEAGLSEDEVMEMLSGVVGDQLGSIIQSAVQSEINRLKGRLD